MKIIIVILAKLILIENNIIIYIDSNKSEKNNNNFNLWDNGSIKYIFLKRGVVSMAERKTIKINMDN